MPYCTNNRYFRIIYCPSNHLFIKRPQIFNRSTTTTTDEKNPEVVVSAPNVPSFAFFCNLPQWVKEPYRRYLENKIRERWNFCGTPINIFMRSK